MINENTNDLLERFYNFYDAVVRKISIGYQNSLEEKKIEVILSVRDKQLSFNEDDWVNVVINILGVTQFAFRENERESYQVLSSGLHILNTEKLLYLDFGYFVDTPEYQDEFVESEFYIVGKTLNWKVIDYQE